MEARAAFLFDRQSFTTWPTGIVGHLRILRQIGKVAKKKRCQASAIAHLRGKSGRCLSQFRIRCLAHSEPAPTANGPPRMSGIARCDRAIGRITPRPHAKRDPEEELLVNAAYLLLTSAWMAGADPAPAAPAAAAPVVSTGSCCGG